MSRTPLGDPTPRAVAVVVRGHKLLVIRRHLDGRDYAVLPGGGIEPGETAAQAAVRELAEECGLDGRVERLLFEGDHGGRSATYFLVHAPDGEPVLGGPEAQAHAPDNSFEPIWVTAPELAPLGFLPADAREQVVEAAWPLSVHPLQPDEWPVVARLWQLYCHDLSQFRHSAPDATGSFAPGRLPSYERDPDRRGYLARLGDVPVGFALVRDVKGTGTVMGEFFVCRSARGSGVAAAMATSVIRERPGRWGIAFQEENPRAARFWRRLGADLLTDVTEKRRAVPGKPHLPHDVWLEGFCRAGQDRERAASTAW